jgi:hypothetical protein
MIQLFKKVRITYNLERRKYYSLLYLMRAKWIFEIEGAYKVLMPLFNDDDMIDSALLSFRVKGCMQALNLHHASRERESERQ